MPNALVVGSYASNAAGERTYIAQLSGKANFDRPSLMPRGGDRKSAVVNELARVNRNSMQGVAPALDALKAEGLLTSYEVNPLSNTVTYSVAGARTAEAWKAVNAVEGVGRITRDREVNLIGLADVKEGATVLMTFADPTPPAPPAAPAVEWNVDRVGAQKVWAQGF